MYLVNKCIYNVIETQITGSQQIGNSVTMIVMTTAAAVIAIVIFGTMCKRYVRKINEYIDIQLRYSNYM